MDEEEASLHVFGTPLEPLDEEKIPSKKPIAIEDQIVTDENGRRRFHGAFTGGFSAGFWNTVGSLEGWTPSSFKSSRSEKAPQRHQQRPEDFMDDEDMGEFGIAPHRVQAKKDFQIDTKENRKRKLAQPNVGPIPGAPVLEELLRPVEDKIAVRILKSMGWKPGQGIGPRQTRKEKKNARERNAREIYLMERYGCYTKPANKVHSGEEDDDIAVGNDEEDNGDDDDDDDDDEITFAPDDYDTLVCVPKTNLYGIGYTGLNRDPVLSQGGGTNSNALQLKSQHFSLFDPLEMLDKNNKKVTISGQAFGVGALEEEDDDIYARDDMTKYDFSLADSKPKKEKRIRHIQDKHIIEGFVEAKNLILYPITYTVELPPNFRPRNMLLRRSRFEPLDVERAQKLGLDSEYRNRGLGRHDLNAEQRQEILEGKPTEKRPQKRGSEHLEPASTSKAAAIEMRKEQILQKRESERQDLLKLLASKNEKFTTGGVISREGEELKADTSVEADRVATDKDSVTSGSKKDQTLGTSGDLSSFKPFLGNTDKQKRYEQFLDANLSTEDDVKAFLVTIQPLHLSEWDREMEKKEFMQARRIFKPLDGIMGDRFVSEATVKTEKTKDKDEGKEKEEKKITVERTKVMWKPDSLLCKRYNIPEPFGGTMADEKQVKKKAKLSVFDYIDVSVNKRADFKTPVVIPKSLEVDRKVEKQSSVKSSSTQANEKDDKKVDDTSARHSVTSSLEQEPDGSEKSETDRHASSVGGVSAAPIKKFVPKTDLERRVDESRDIPASEKVDLFRAIFEDSESENESEEKTDSAGATDASQSEASNVGKVNAAIAANLLRNTSPPRGIFAALFGKPTTSAGQETSKSEKQTITETRAEEVKPEIGSNVSSKDINAQPPKITFKSKSERLMEQKPDEFNSTDVYGPQIPTHIKSPETIANATTVEVDGMDDKILELLRKNKSIGKIKKPKENFVWVEKSEANKTTSSSVDSAESSSSDSESDSKNYKKAKRKKKTKLKKSKKKKTKKKSSKHSKKSKVK